MADKDKNFDILDALKNSSSDFADMLRTFLPDECDDFLDTLENSRDLVIEYIDKLDKKLLTPLDAINFIGNIADDCVSWVKRKTNEKKEKDSIQEKSANKKYSHDLNDWIPYESVDDNAKIMSQKFKDLIEARKRAGEDIDISKGVPTLEEMFADDLAYDFFKGLANSEEKENVNKEVKSQAFYYEAPSSLNIGYNDKDHTFMLECGPGALVDLKKEMHLNAIDGDTYHMYLDQISSTDKFNINGTEYKNFVDYCEKNNLNSKKLQIRAIGIQCPELPHYNGMVMKESQIKKMTIKEAKSKGNGAVYRKYDYKSGIVTDRNLDKEISWYYDEEAKKYYEISEFDAWSYYSESGSLVNKDIYQCNIIVTSDDSEKDTLADGYRARTVAYSVLKNADRIMMKLDANGMKANKTTGKNKLYYNHWWNADKAISGMIDQWHNAMVDNAPVTRLSYSPFGTDGHGRFVGEVYCYTNVNGKMMWINLNKYVMSHVDSTEVLTDLSSSPELNHIFGNNAKAFDLWSYNKDNLEYLDIFEGQTSENYENRLKFHKQLTGIDFKAFRNCTMMLGDTLLLIPPTSIRNVSGVEYEKVNVLRGKGSMVKGVTAREQYLEIDLYFYDEFGINGIPYVHTLPNGQKMTYYMNGLRSLIAQFKVAPYLPIENQYINDILGIEAVSLVNLNVNTVEGFPRLLQVTLTLRDFNYRIFMPDIPFDYGITVNKDGQLEAEIESIDQISEMNPIFAKCIHWEIFRYYYQRSINQGNALGLLTYNTPEYNDQYYKSRNALKLVNFCDKADTVSFYVPDEDWLSDALHVKKNKDYYGQNPINIELTEAGKDFFERCAGVSNLKANKDHAKQIADSCVVHTDDKTSGVNLYRKNILGKNGEESLIEVIKTGNSIFASKNKKTLLENLIMDIANNIESCGALRYNQTNEKYNKNDRTLTWEIKFNITGTNLNSTDMLSIKETLKDITGVGSSFDVLKDNQLTVNITADITDNGKIDPNMTVSSPELQAISGYMEGAKEHPDAKEFDYLNPAAMKFVPYIEEVPLQGLAFNMSNTFTEMSLKMMDGSAPQYMGASDISMELRIVTDNSLIISMLNVLPSHSMNITKSYRRILNCWPIRIRQSFINMAGINEVLIDSIQIESVEGYPGLYDLRMRLTSVDRTMRNREMLKQLDSKQDMSTLAQQSISSYFDIENTLALAETYPDLDLPSLFELNSIGYKFLKYSGIARSYPDPDFYMVYSYQYTSQIIKKAIKESFIKKGIIKTKEDTVECDKDGNLETMFSDQTGQRLVTRLEGTTGFEITKMNGTAFYYTEAINSADSLDRFDRKKNLEYDEEFAGNVDAITTMTLFNVEEGWQIKPGWEATICPAGIEDYVRQCKNSNLNSENTPPEISNNTVYTTIFEKRKKAIELIDSILSKPLDYVNVLAYDSSDGSKLDDSGGGNESNMKNIDESLNGAVNYFFNTSSTGGKQLLELLCPMGEIKFSTGGRTKFWTNETNQFEKPNVLSFLMAYLFAAGCALSGQSYKVVDSEWEKYFPNQYLRQNGSAVKDKSKDMPAVPNVAIETATNPKYAKTTKEAIEKGFAFGMYQIKYETKDEIKARILPKCQVDYLGGGKTFKFYDDYKDGFIDPYYNKLKKDSKELKEYKEAISKSAGVNACAFIRIVLVYLRKQIIEGLVISDLDVMAEEYDSEVKGTAEKIVVEAAQDTAQHMNMGGVGKEGMMVDSEQLLKFYTAAEEQNFKDVTGEEQGEANKEQLALLKSLEESYAQSFCTRMILPFAEAATQSLTGPDTTFNDLLYNRKLNDLNVLSATLLGAHGTSNQLISKFLMALSGNIINSSNTGTSASTTSDSQKVMNFLMREAFTELSENPQYYLLHSFYDMLVNDKRGRLVRAFPTYYIAFIDEGRRIGSWKLYDNFYNMSSIADLTVSKSRKIPADTCSFVMTNMFGSYASEYDNTVRQNYTDLYSIRDTFTSIFSPKIFVQKEAAIRAREDNTEQTVLAPGVRIHIRMGYGSDAASLPVVFNGKIAEIDIGDVVTVIGQGDGTELTNPLNALGDVDATNLIESQSWCTLFKDIRGSFSRGGLSPRNLLSQVLTAEHGGTIKNIIRTVSDETYFNDNPFGIYHFGDKRFGEIFSEGESTQNLYEVTDGTLLAGMNTLYPQDGGTSCSPTLNTTIQDKTFWDLLTMAAYSGIGYIGAVRDFGFRSTVCLCKRNHYYAFAYAMSDGKIIERRKPFQQFHYYDSYTDIIYNSIKASEKNIKTNATGIWEGTDAIWGSESKTCGPIYLDLNIYPEYQKSMTVDTGLMAAGNGGIDIPVITHYAEDWNLNANADKVNKSLAERITTNTLRETIMNMYTGEICVIGDPSVKPYDRISVSDYYEDMFGQMEVEAVVYSMNASTGFTTTIYPDLIVRQDDPHEVAKQQILGAMVAGFISVVGGRLAVIAPLARIQSKLLTSFTTFITGAASASGVEGALGAAASTSIGKFFGIQKGAGLLKSLGSIVSSITPATLVWGAVATAVVFVMTQNAKSYLTRWIRNIQALDVYPVIKNQRPYIAGMNGHKGSVVGYAYTETDGEDSIQGIVMKCIETLDKNCVTSVLTSVFLDRNEYNNIVNNWTNTLTTLNGNEKLTTVEDVYQLALNEVSTEFRNRTDSISMLRTKFRLRSFDTKNGTDPTYHKYRILGVTTSKNVDASKKVLNAINETSVFTNKNLLDLFPIEDDVDIKKAIAGTHPVVKDFKIAHSTGTLTANLPFESGSRIIRFIAENNNTSSLAGYPILDMPMVQEDALYLLKLILNNQHLSKAKLEFTSGVRVNDIRTWKNTGYAFELHTNDSKSLKSALDELREQLTWTMNGVEYPFFAYQQSGETFVISVYPSVENNSKEGGSEDGNAK